MHVQEVELRHSIVGNVRFHRNLAVVTRSKHRQDMARYFPSVDGTGDGDNAVKADLSGFCKARSFAWRRD